MNKSLFSSNSNEWETPGDLYNSLDAEFHFTLDPCSTEANHKCPKYYTRLDDGLSKDWSGERVFMNPPYGREIGKWIKKAYESGTLVVCLIPARTDTAYWQDYVIRHSSDTRFIRGRLRFLIDGKPVPHINKKGLLTFPKAPFPSAIVIFNPDAPK